MRLAPLIAITAGAASVLAYAPFHFSPLIFIAWAVLFDLQRRAATPGQAFRLGWLWGLGAFFAGLGWLTIALHRFGGMPLSLSVFAILLFAAYLALYPALASWAMRRLHSSNPLRNSLAAASAWTGAELLRGYLFTGIPPLALGYSQTPPSPLAGFAPIFGSYGLSFLVAWLSALSLIAVLERRWRMLLPVAIVLLAGAGLRWLPWTQPVGAPTSFALLQPNIPQDMKWQPERVMQWLELNYKMVAANPAQVVVLPETTIPMLQEHLPEGYLDALKASVGAQGGDAVLGVFTRDAQGRIYNSAISLGTAPSQTYSKNHLVPFGEYAPPWFGWFYTLVNIPMSDQSRGGAKQPVMHIGGQKIAVNICYEDVFGEEIIGALPEATILLNLSNLAWYGDSHAQPQHLQIAQLRAMESGRPMLRSTNTGMTAAIAPDGIVTDVLPAFTQGALKVSVRGYHGTTPYALWANWPVIVLCLIVLGEALLHRRRVI